MHLGCIADDFTGSSDLGATLAREGMRTVQYCGIPAQDAAPDVDAGIVALKSRTCHADQAVADSLAALTWLQRQGCRQIFFKYCSTFDSTPEGNIGPVIEALMAALKTDRALVCPAFPATGRRIFQGHLFVGDKLLHESGMQHHPLTPMTDSDIRRWLSLQTRQAVGHVPWSEVSGGPGAIEAALEREVVSGRPIVVLDAIEDNDLLRIGAAAAEVKLVTGGSGVAMGLPANFRDGGSYADRAAPWRGSAGAGVVLSGSCSAATREQVALYAEDHPALRIDSERVVRQEQTAEEVAGWLLNCVAASPIAYSTSAPDAVEATRARYGRQSVADAVERLFAEVAVRLAAEGVERFVIAGGETSGAIVSALKIESLEIGPEIATGVPALHVSGGRIALALKSGNFGAAGFFEHAMRMLGVEG